MTIAECWRPAVLAALFAGGTVTGAVRADELEVRVAAASETRGQLLFLQCKACHDLNPALPHKVGPNLNGVIGRKAGTVGGYPFSAAMRESGLTWDLATLDAFLRQPGAVVPGSGMAFAGIAADADRASLLRYLQKAAAPPAPPPP
jgi:cytochrome c